MSDDGGMGATGGGADEDISLPKATVAKLVQGQFSRSILFSWASD